MKRCGFPAAAAVPGAVPKIPAPEAIVRNVAVDRARGRVWLAESGAERLGRIDLPAAGR